jgi:hypothetical protein
MKVPLEIFTNQEEISFAGSPPIKNKETDGLDFM